MKKFIVIIAIFSVIFVATTQAKAFWVMDWPDIITTEPVISYGLNSVDLGAAWGFAVTTHLSIVWLLPPADQDLMVQLDRTGNVINLTDIGGNLIWPAYACFKKTQVSGDCYEITGKYSTDGRSWWDLEPYTYCP